MTKRSIVGFLQSKTLAIITMAVSYIMAMCFHGDSITKFHAVANGLVYNIAYGATPVALIITVNYLLLAACSLLLVIINREFKLVRSTSWYFVTMFFLIVLSFTSLTAQWNSGTQLVTLLSLLTYLLFSIYSKKDSNTTIFLLFFIIALASLWISTTAFFLLTFLIGLGQMRVISIKALLAALLGVITPLWIVWGLEWAKPFDFNITQWHDAYDQIITMFRTRQLLTILIILLGSVGYLLTAIMKTLNYNAARRAYNGFIAFLTLTTIILIALEVTEVMVYIPTVALLLAFLTSHSLFSRYTIPSLPATLSPLLVFVALAVWNFL